MIESLRIRDLAIVEAAGNNLNVLRHRRVRPMKSAAAKWMIKGAAAKGRMARRPKRLEPPGRGV